MRLGTKADLLHCIMTDDTDSQPAPVVDAVFLDGAAVVQMRNPGTAKTFQNYADSVFVPYAKSQLEKTRRLDMSERNHPTEEREGNQETGDANHCTAKALERLSAC